MWLLKIILKIIFSRLNIKYSYWKKFRIFRHGQMENFGYSRKIFEGHFRDMNKVNKIDNPIIMEIGPGDSLFSMIYSRKYSNEKFYFLDVNDFASKDLNLYLKLQKKLDNENYFPKKIKSQIQSFDDLLKNYNAKYLIKGLQSLRKIDDNSIDYIFSHSVIEHIRKYEINNFIEEIYRILKPNGVISHNINYKDHLGESLNNLRFSEQIWESNLFAKSGFYTNRIPAVEMHKNFQKCGFNLVEEDFGRWDKLPILRSSLSKEFRKYTNDELARPTSRFIAIK
tara:strand:+ start:642 stop:1487 length:846 start_codon:yes stop_codon:yes gene_type:complete